MKRITRKDIMKLIEEELRVVEENAGNLGEAVTKPQVKAIMNAPHLKYWFSPRDAEISDAWHYWGVEDLKGILGNNKRSKEGAILQSNDGDNIAVVLKDPEGGYSIIEPDGAITTAKSIVNLRKKLTELISNAGLEINNDEVKYKTITNPRSTERSQKSRERSRLNKEDNGLNKLSYDAVKKLVDKAVFSDEEKALTLAKFIVELTSKWSDIYDNFNKDGFGGSSIDLRDFDSMTEIEKSPWGGRDAKVSKARAKEKELTKKLRKRNESRED